MPMKKISSWLMLASMWLCASVAHAGTVTYVYTDPQGTPLAEADASGNITARFEYTPYGVSVPSMGAAPNGVGYTGHVNDPESGLVYMQARYYDAEVGRFLSVDPLGPEAANPFSINRFAYVNNNPVSGTDPTGMCADHYDDGSCKVSIDPSISGEKSAQTAQRDVEEVLNNYDKSVNSLSDNSVYNVPSEFHDIGMIGSMSGGEIKEVWNSTHFSIVPNDTKFNNGGGGGGTGNGLSQLTPKVVSDYKEVSPTRGVISLVFHELGHETSAGKQAARGNEYDTKGPAFEARERKVQSIGKSMAGSVKAPFSCKVSKYGCQ